MTAKVNASLPANVLIIAKLQCVYVETMTPSVARSSEVITFNFYGIFFFVSILFTHCCSKTGEILLENINAFGSKKLQINLCSQKRLDFC